MVMASDPVNELHDLKKEVPHPREDYFRTFHPEDLTQAKKAFDSVASGEVGSAHVVVRLVPQSGVEVRHITVTVGQ